MSILRKVRSTKNAIAWSAFTAGALFATAVFAGDAEDMAAMQQRLNQEVMSKPFTVEDAKKIDAYVEDALKKGVKPVQSAPTYWQPGYTCTNLWAHSYYDYQNCAYYYRYYGRYW